jgi:catechol 2,3-dioxygenase-like lactoylglutathione lyase family enzyme
MPAPNQFIVYVADAPASARFYSNLFDLKPVLETPGFISFDLGNGFSFSVWSRPSAEATEANSRTGEVCVSLTGGPLAIDEVYEEWKTKGVNVVDEPHDEGFGRAFVVADPDGNLIRVAPTD